MWVSRPKTAIGGAALVFSLALGAMGPASATPKTYNFEGLATGTIVWGVEPDGEMLNPDLYPDFELQAVGTMATNSLCVFDTAHPTGRDWDLGTPNQGFGGPGRGLGGAPGMPGENAVPQGKVLIIPENLTDINLDGLVDDPDDNENGGTIAIRFGATGLLYSMTLVDIEEVGGSIDCYLGDQLVQSFPLPALGDNCQVTVPTRTTGMIDRTVISLVGSGALAAMTFETFVVPVEPTTWGGIKSTYGR